VPIDGDIEYATHQWQSLIGYQADFIFVIFYQLVECLHGFRNCILVELSRQPKRTGLRFWSCRHDTIQAGVRCAPLSRLELFADALHWGRIAATKGMSPILV
jgi:hypothetical protein